MKSKITKSYKKSKHNFPFYYKIEGTYAQVLKDSVYSIYFEPNNNINSVTLNHYTNLSKVSIADRLESYKENEISESEWIDAIYSVLHLTLEAAGTVQKF